MILKDFQLINLQLQSDIFSQLYNSVQLEALSRGRFGNYLVDKNKFGIPIVRTTAQYTIPPEFFKPIHKNIIECINEKITINKSGKNSKNRKNHFNHALIEIYENTYCKMNYHSDQALDLDPNSYIALFTCYENPDILSENQLRKLKVKDKFTGDENEIVLSNNSVVLFSVQTNAKFKHKIVLEGRYKNNNTVENRCLGITFRCSKTLINFVNNKPFFNTGQQLVMANEIQSKEFYTFKSQENNQVNFIYPSINYTLNSADFLQPKK
jgi:hypothetical protein